MTNQKTLTQEELIDQGLVRMFPKLHRDAELYVRQSQKDEWSSRVESAHRRLRREAIASIRRKLERSQSVSGSASSSGSASGSASASAEGTQLTRVRR